jgi:hypothetical protein
MLHNAPLVTTYDDTGGYAVQNRTFLKYRAVSFHDSCAVLGRADFSGRLFGGTVLNLVNPVRSQQEEKGRERKRKEEKLGVRWATTKAGAVRKMNGQRCLHYRMTCGGGRPMEWGMINSSSATRNVPDTFLIW